MPPAGTRSSRAVRIAVIVSRYNGSITSRLREGAVRTLGERLGGRGRIDVVAAPGAFELPALALAAARTGRYDGVVALGCLIKGQTRHDRYIAEAVAHGLVGVTLATGVPAAFGVITAETAAQAAARAGGSHGNKGEEAAAALLETIEASRAIRAGRMPVADNAVPVPDKAAGLKARRGGRSTKTTTRKEAARH